MLGDWLGHYRVLTGVGIFAPLGVWKSGMTISGLFKRLQRRIVSFESVLDSELLFCVLGARLYICGLGAARQK